MPPANIPGTLVAIVFGSTFGPRVFGSISIPAFFVSNLSLSHAFDLRHGQLGLTFYVNNLLNAKYYASAWVYRAWQGAVAEDGSARDPYYLEAGVFPQATRNWMLKVSWRF